MGEASDATLYSFLRQLAATQPDPAFFRVPKVAGRYQVGERLGQGGLGLVHAGWDPELSRSVAIKFVRLDRTGGGAGDQLQARLRQEAMALARLAHPNVVPVFDVGEVDGQVFLAMQRIDGTTLRAWLDKRRSVGRIVAVFTDAARGLSAAHQVGVIHRDFKPDNVLVDSHDHAWVVDFGIAQSTSEETQPSDGRSGTSPVMGTRGYLAPELFHGEMPSPQSDQFAFCRTLDAAVGARGPAWLRRVVARGLDPDPDRRFASMQALVCALHEGADRRMWRSVAVVAGLGALGLAVSIPGRPRAPRYDAPTLAVVLPTGGVPSRLAQARQLRSDGAHEAARTHANAALIEAQALDNPSLIAEANLLRGELASDLSDPAASAYVQAAFFAAQGAGAPELALDAATTLAGLELSEGRIAGARYWLEHGRALATQSDEAELLTISGGIKMMAGAAQEGLDELDRAIALHTDERAAAAVCVSAGQAALALDDPARARHYFERALAAYGDSPDAADALYHLGVVELETAQPKAALDHLRRALKIEEEMREPTTLWAALLHMQIGNALRDLGQMDDALVELQTAARLVGAPALRDSPDHAVVLEALGLIHEILEQLPEARQAYDRALVIREATAGRDHEMTAHTLLRLSGVAYASGELERALNHAVEARGILVRTLGPTSVLVAATHGAAAEINLRLGKLAAARVDGERAVELYGMTARLPDEHARAQALLAEILWPDASQRARARVLAGKAEAFYEAAGPGYAEMLEATRAWLRDHE